MEKYISFCLSSLTTEAKKNQFKLQIEKKIMKNFKYKLQTIFNLKQLRIALL